jgi:glycosyltransferase involved in cell wall biosynthesis
MSIYYKEKSKYFDRAMVSIWDEQTIKPNEIILVQDGKLTEELNNTIQKWQEKLGDIFKIIPLEKNLGTGKAKNIGLKECNFDLVAIMDTDDISMPNRFEQQLQVFENMDVDVCSSWVSEFDTNEDNIVSYRKLPEVDKEILNFAKKRMPVNHPATMYKRVLAIKVGGYKHMLWFEDYYLMVRMILNNAKFYNIQESLVNMRAGYGHLERRSGLKYAIREFNFLKELYNIKFFSINNFIKNVIIRFIVRILPTNLVKSIYKILRS